jgi:alkylation response protein AidB-like acyl-CoA dehydrogenase
MTAPLLAFEHDRDEADIREAVRSFALDSGALNVARLHLEADDEADKRSETVWQSLVNDLGFHVLLSLGADDVARPFGYVAAVAEELGAELLGSPFMSTAAYAAAIVRKLGTHEQPPEQLSGALEAGTRFAVVTHPDGDVRIETDGARTTVTGTYDYVLDGPGAAVYLVVATVNGKDALLATTPNPGTEDTSRVTRVKMSMLDPSRPVARIAFDAAEVNILAVDSTAHDAHLAGLQAARLAGCAEACGGMRRLVDMTSEYARTRRQFGQAIGTFQGVKHRLADMHVALESARSATAYAAHLLDLGSEDAGFYVDIAWAFSSAAYVQAAFDAIQLHGGIGFTWEHDAHLFLRRARANSALLGDPDDIIDGLAKTVDAQASRAKVKTPATTGDDA